MIAHAVTGSGFKGVVSYLETGYTKDAHGRVAWSQVRNLASDDLQLSASIMRHTANQSVRCKKPVYHMAISWPEGDKVNDATMQKVAQKTLEDIGLAEHQALIVAHNDTDHKHIHVVVNRVHPETGKAWATSHDRKRIMQSLRVQEKELGLQYVPNRLTDRELTKEEPSKSREAVMQERRLEKQKQQKRSKAKEQMLKELKEARELWELERDDDELER